MPVRPDHRVRRKQNALAAAIVVADLLAFRLAVLVVSIPIPARVADVSFHAEHPARGVAVGIDDLADFLREVFAHDGGHGRERERIDAREKAAVAEPRAYRPLERGVAGHIGVVGRDTAIDLIGAESGRRLLDVDPEHVGVRQVEEAPQVVGEVIGHADHGVRPLGLRDHRHAVVDRPPVTADLIREQAQSAVLADIEGHDAGARGIQLLSGRAARNVVEDHAGEARLIGAPIGDDDVLRQTRDRLDIGRTDGRARETAVREDADTLRAPVARVSATQNRILCLVLRTRHDVAAAVEQLRASGDRRYAGFRRRRPTSRSRDRA